jgi:hypothetical protein
MVREIVENRSARGANITFSAENAALEPIILMKNDWMERVLRLRLRVQNGMPKRAARATGPHHDPPAKPP